MSTPSPSDRPSDRPWYRWLAIALLATCGVYAWYVFQRAERLSELNQRQLASSAMELRRALENAVATVDNFNPVDDRDEYKLCDFDDDQPYLSLMTDCKPSPGPLNHVALKTESSLVIEGRPKNRSDSDWRASFPFAFNADLLFQELAFSESFHLVFVTNATGKVLVQSAPASHQWRRMLRWGEQAVRDSSADVAPSIQLHHLSDALAGGSTAWQALSAASSRTRLQIGGTWHQLYLQPLAASGERLVIGGLVPTATVVREALVVDGSFVAMLVFAVLLGAFGYPFVRLSLLDRCERFRRRDLTLLHLSTAALLVLFSFAALGFDGYQRWDAVADRGLEQLARTLAEQFATEVGLIRDEVEALEEGAGTRLKPLFPKDCDKSGATHWSEPLGERQRSVFLEQVAWIKPDGQQLWKITADKVGSLVRVDHRAYFKAVRDGELYQVAGRGTPFFIGSDRSITDGKFRTFVSIASTLPEDFYPKNCRGRYVAAATAPLMSLHRPALPAGYGFAVVNREGHVLYHSNPRLSLRENLFEELSDGGRVRAIVYSGRDGELATRYRQRPHCLFLQPIDLQRAGDHSHSGLYMVAFRDSWMERTVVARVFVAGLAILLPLLTCIGSTMWLAALTSARRRRGWGRWLWPHGGSRPMYRSVALSLSGVFAAGLALAHLGFADAVLVVVPLVAVITIVVVSARFSGLRSPRCSASPWWYTAMLVMFLGCLVLVPSAVLFRTTLGHEFGNLVDTEQEWIHAQEYDALLELSAAARAEGYPQPVVEQLARNRRNYSQVTTIPPFDAVLHGPGPGVAGTIALLQELDRRLPIGNYTVARQRYREGKYYSPPGTLPGPWSITGVAVVCFTVVLALLVAWICWSRSRIFYADHKSGSRSDAPSDFEKAWAECGEDERHVLIQVTREGIANPRQQPLVANLIRRGLLRLDPDLQACSDAFQQFIRKQEKVLANELASWERVHTDQRWRHFRNGFVAVVGGLAFFLIATQPGLQSNLVGIATGLTGMLATGAKLRDAIAPWFARGKASS